MYQNNIFFNTTDINALRVISLKMAKYFPLKEENDIYIYIYIYIYSRLFASPYHPYNKKMLLKAYHIIG